MGETKGRKGTGPDFAAQPPLMKDELSGELSEGQSMEPNISSIAWKLPTYSKILQHILGTDRSVL